ncbi:unnamed protein product [Durusdinium trenchii]|uniref:Kinesin motor domain-containing protein n=2 Tax=Durusdinium trenchii TaxID=1381693 RepID=A0ABP0HRG4_9DINO
MGDAESPQGKLTRRVTNVNDVNVAVPNPNNIRVAVRIRPFNAKELSEGSAAETVLEVEDSTVIARPEFGRGEKRYNFDSVFKSMDPTKEGSQADVFQELGIPILENALDAYNGCIMAYGQTGSGKSYSVCSLPLASRVKDIDMEEGTAPRGWTIRRLRDLVSMNVSQASGGSGSYPAADQRCKSDGSPLEAKQETKKAAKALRFQESADFMSPMSHSSRLSHCTSSSLSSPSSPGLPTKNVVSNWSMDSSEQQLEEEEDRKLQLSMEAASAKREKEKKKFSVACVRSQEPPPLERIRPEMSKLWNRRARNTSEDDCSSLSTRLPQGGRISL